jgi:hypothetical protein
MTTVIYHFQTRTYNYRDEDAGGWDNKFYVLSSYEAARREFISFIQDRYGIGADESYLKDIGRHDNDGGEEYNYHDGTDDYNLVSGFIVVARFIIKHFNIYGLKETDIKDILSEHDYFSARYYKSPKGIYEYTEYEDKNYWDMKGRIKEYDEAGAEPTEQRTKRLAMYKEKLEEKSSKHPEYLEKNTPEGCRLTRAWWEKEFSKEELQIHVDNVRSIISSDAWKNIAELAFYSRAGEPSIPNAGRATRHTLIEKANGISISWNDVEVYNTITIYIAGEAGDSCMAIEHAEYDDYYDSKQGKADRKADAERQSEIATMMGEGGYNCMSQDENGTVTMWRD